MGDQMGTGRGGKFGNLLVNVHHGAKVIFSRMSSGTSRILELDPIMIYLFGNGRPNEEEACRKIWGSLMKKSHFRGI